MDKINIIVAFRGYRDGLLDMYEKKIENILNYDCWGWLPLIEKSNYMTWSWLMAHEAELQGTYNLLQDELSRKSFVAFINQKISMKLGFLSEVVSPYQYFDEALVHFTDKETFVDCGAYTGDTAQAFINALKRRGISTYKKIISFEPSSEAFMKMKELGLERHRCINKGVSDKAGVLSFLEGGEDGTFCENGDIKVEVDSIDHVVQDDVVTMIKMDIEGSELSALHGAENVIKRSHPLLAISCYHKKDDLYEIPRYINELFPGYKFYLRAHKEVAVDLVLYAVPPTIGKAFE